MKYYYIRILEALIVLACLLLFANGNAAAGTIIDNTDILFSTVGSWPSSTSVTGYDGSDYQIASKGNGSATATWQFNIDTDGHYDVEAQWTAYGNRANNAHYTLYNNGIFVANVTTNQQINGGQFNLLGSYNLTAGTLEVVLDNNASGYVVADAVQVTYTGAPINQPPDGTIDTPTGNKTITVGDFINFTGTYSDPDGDPVQGYLWEFGSGSGLANSSAKDPGQMQFNNTGVFTVKFTVTDSNGAQDPTPAQVTVTVVAQGSSSSMDNSDAGFSTVGSWPSSTSVTGYDGSDYQIASKGNGSATATWQFNIVTDGHYDVEAQWTAYGNRANNAHYTLYNNGIFVANVTTNQQINGGQFNLLGSYNLTAGTLEVVLDNNASGYVVADAVQVTYTGTPINQPPDGTIDTPTGNKTITVGDFINFTGTYSDPDGDPVQGYLWEFGSGSGLANSSAKDPGQMQFNNTGVFTVKFTVTDSNGAQDPTPAQVTVTVVAQGSSSSIMDNSAVGFSTVGNWPSSTSVTGYYGSDYQFTDKGDGSATATWQFNIDTDGYYDVNARWTKYFNRATNAPYTLYNNGNFVALVRVNQQTKGGQFNLLGTYPLAAGTLTIILDNDASGYVVADAISINIASPQIVITSPINNSLYSSSYVTVDVGVHNLPADWGVEFVLDGNPATSVLDYNTPFEHTFVSLPKAEHGVDVYLVDAAATRQSGFSDHTGFGVGDYFIALGDSITRGSPTHDDITSDNTSADGRNTGGGYEPILNDLLTAKSGYPQTVINAGVSGDSTSDALLRLPALLSNNPEANYVLILLGTNDAYWGGLDSGVGLMPGETGYADTYKDHMQQIISTVVASGKIPVLAKVLIVQPFDDIANPLIQQYNTVIDELALFNGITLVPPDFYTYFQNHPELFDDNLHPNGAGFIGMANLWSDVFTY